MSQIGTVAAIAMQSFDLAIQNAMTIANTATSSGISQMTATVGTGVMQIKSTTEAGAQATLAAIRSAMASFVAAVNAGGAAAVAACGSTASGMVSAFAGLSGSMYSAGSFAMAGLRNGIAAGGAAAIAQARSIANQVAATVNSALKIHSPSRVLDQSGQYAGQGFAGGIQKTGALVQKAASESLALPVMDAGSKTLEAPQFESRSSVIGDTVNSFRGQNNQNAGQQQTAGQTFVFSPTYRFEGGAPSKSDIVEANKMSQDDFKKMMREYLRTEGRRAFA